MSMLDSYTARCALCGAETAFDEILSTSSVGSSDLDTRSPAMRWAIIQTLVQRCPGCGYCASDVSVVNPDASAVINGREYQGQLHDPAYPELINSFLCKAILDRESKTFSNATWSLMQAAWFCDDADHVKLAQVCRNKAADMLMLAEEHNQKIAKQDGMSVAILVDLLRRSEQVDRARKLIEARRGGITDDLIKRILDYQSELLDKKDFSRHTIAEARSHLKKNQTEVPDTEEHQATAESPRDQFDADLTEDTDAEVIWEEYKREKGNESSSIDLADHEAIWDEYHQSILDEQQRKKEDEYDFYGYTDPNDAWAAYQQEKEKEKIVTYLQKVSDSLETNGIEATIKKIEEDKKSIEKTKKNKEKWDEIIKIAGVVLITAFFMSKCGDTNDQSNCYYEYGKYGAERICE